MSNNTDSDRDPPSTDEGNVVLGFYIASLILGFGDNTEFGNNSDIKEETEPFDSQTFYSQSCYFLFKLHQ